MLVLDDIVTLPVRGLLALARRIHQAALEEREQDAQRLRDDLARLYAMLETRQISEAEFDAREAELLRRLEQVDPRLTPPHEEEEAQA